MQIVEYLAAVIPIMSKFESFDARHPWQPLKGGRGGEGRGPLTGTAPRANKTTSSSVLETFLLSLRRTWDQKKSSGLVSLKLIPNYLFQFRHAVTEQ